MDRSGNVFVIDDDPAMCDLMEATLKHAGMNVRTFSSVDAYTRAAEASAHATFGENSPCCLLLDLVLPGTSGLEFLESHFRKPLPCPVIVITAQGSIRAAVKSMKLGAVDFLEKPFSPEELKAAVLEAMQKRQRDTTHVREREEIRTRVARLSPRERELLNAIVKGQSTKMIAETLGISVRTVDHHRANLMDKMRATNVADLVRMAMLVSESEGNNSPPPR